VSTVPFPIPEVYGRLVDLAAALGVSEINQLPGCWIHRIDDDWTVAANGHREPMRAAPGGAMDVEILPFEMAIWWHGWLAGIIGPSGGAIADHPEGANEKHLLVAIDWAIAQTAEKR